MVKKIIVVEYITLCDDFEFGCLILVNSVVYLSALVGSTRVETRPGVMRLKPQAVFMRSWHYNIYNLYIFFKMLWPL